MLTLEDFVKIRELYFKGRVGHQEDFEDLRLRTPDRAKGDPRLRGRPAPEVPPVEASAQAGRHTGSAQVRARDPGSGQEGTAQAAAYGSADLEACVLREALVEHR